MPVLGGVSVARAEGWVNFYPLEGELSLGVDSQWRRSDGGDSTSQLTIDERLRLNIGGYGLDPRFFNFNVRLEPELEQRTTDSGTGKTSSDSTFLNYAARFDFLSGVQVSPFALSGSMAGSSSEVEGSLGNRSDITIEDRGADLRWKFRAFPMSVGYKERSLYEVFTPSFGASPTVRDEFQRTITAKARSSKMEWYWESNDFDDLTGVDNDYKSQKARLSNNFRWGKGSTLTSQLDYGDREGFNENERFNVNESLRLQHLENLYTSYGYSYEWLSRTTETETQRGSFELNHRLYKNLTTSLKLSGTDTKSEDLMEETYDADLDFKYVKEIKPGVRLRSNLGGGYRTSERIGGRLDFSESPTVPITGIVPLIQRYIVWSTIIVTAPGCTPCLEGTDYFVEDAGGDFTQLRIPGGSRIAIGDVITVDYAYEPPTVEFYGIPYRAGVRLDFGWVAVYLNTSGENQTFVAGPDPDAVRDRRTDTAGVEFSWARPRMEATASAERKYSQIGTQEKTEYILLQSLKYRIASNASLTANFSESFFRDGSDVDAYNANLSANWFPAPGLTVNPYLSAFHRDQDPGGTENFMNVGVNLLWKWRRLSMDMRYDHSQRNNDGRGTIEDRLTFNAKRRF
jgi:hypothetical protein